MRSTGLPLRRATEKAAHASTPGPVGGTASTVPPASSPAVPKTAVPGARRLPPPLVTM
ncbi:MULTISPECIES: hypothetical protein [Streptomyces]|uniref:hypothetical protein n=1 Tax=Streptomyces TaxID=1883 RepID=UPI0023DADA66|nr:hypothetical protein [Streptomyces coacervatus]MDF2264311.1 hypothetical protein [Streptomyces coacervatus]